MVTAKKPASKKTAVKKVVAKQEEFRMPQEVKEWIDQQQAEIEAMKKFLDDTCQTGKFIMWNAIKDKTQKKDDDWKQTREYCS